MSIEIKNPLRLVFLIASGARLDQLTLNINTAERGDWLRTISGGGEVLLALIDQHRDCAHLVDAKARLDDAWSKLVDAQGVDGVIALRPISEDRQVSP